jgi:hypothetical protein
MHKEAEAIVISRLTSEIIKDGANLYLTEKVAERACQKSLAVISTEIIIDTENKISNMPGLKKSLV